MSLVVQGDDFTALGPERHLREFEKQMRTWYTIKTRGVLGPEPQDDKEITVLNWKLWRDGLITYEADPRIVGNILEAMGLEEGSKILDTPIVVEDTRGEEDEELSRDQASKFRSVAALANYLALDRPDLQVAVSVLCQKMARPTAGSWLQLKRVAIYLKKYPVLLYEFWEDGEDLELKVFSDSDWAGDRDTSRSRSGGVLVGRRERKEEREEEGEEGEEEGEEGGKGGGGRGRGRRERKKREEEVREGRDKGKRDAAARSTATLLLVLGGLGLRSAARTRAAGFWASWADFAHDRGPSSRGGSPNHRAIGRGTERAQRVACSPSSTWFGRRTRFRTAQLEGFSCRFAFSS